MAKRRTNIRIDEEAVTTVMRRYGLRTKTEAVNMALRRLSKRPMTREELLAMRGRHAIGEIPEDTGPFGMTRDEVLEMDQRRSRESE